MRPHPGDMDMTGLSPVTKTTQTPRRTTARPAWCQAPPGMSAGRRSPRTRLLGCLADRRLHQAHLDTGTLTVAVAVGAGGLPSTATDDDDKPNMLRAGSLPI